MGVKLCLSLCGKKIKLRVFEKGVLRRIFGFEGQEMTRECRELLDEAPHNLYCLLNTIVVIKSRSITGVGHVAVMGEVRIFFPGKPQGKVPFGGCGQKIN
jgi:hypothetical protein